jgi:serine/threonine protein phosphatase 1
MKKLFVVSDIHGFFDEMKAALDKAGFDPTNENHLLVVCGDTTDRGPQPSAVISYLSRLMRDNKCVVVKGNHESLLLECCERGYPGSHDYSNGTFDTICELGGAGGGRAFDECCIVTESRIRPFINKMVDYFETEHYVFVHAWIPVNCDDGLPMHYRHNRNFSKKDDWREAHHSEWEQARWQNPLLMARHGFCIEKTIVAGHWHCSYGHHIDSIGTDNWISEFDEDACFDPYYYKDKLIMIDACTAHTGKVNVLVLEDNLLEE